MRDKLKATNSAEFAGFVIAGELQTSDIRKFAIHDLATALSFAAESERIDSQRLIDLTIGASRYLG
jgi:hypothetical protein